MSILRNDNVPCHHCCSSHVDFEIIHCHLSNLRNTLRHVGNIFLGSIGFMLPADFKKCRCHSVEFRGQGSP